MIGPSNVFLSIYENDSGPEGIAALEDFKKKVPCKHEIVSDAHVSLQGFPRVTMPDGSQRTKRLAYLSEMRNRALRPLDRFTTKAGSVEFDKIMFLNDVAFRPVDAAHLLFNTDIDRDGHTRYLAACALDYKNPFLFYDLYAQRDAHGYSNGLPFFPIFSFSGNETSRQNMLDQKDAVRVSSCWSGMVAMQARYVQNRNSSLPSPGWQDVNSHVIEPARPTNVTAPVRFRHEPEIFYDACECCLFMADVAEAARKADARERAIYVNPYIRVAYDFNTLSWLPLVRRWERVFAVPHAMLSKLARLPTHNPYRTVKEGEVFTEEVWDGKQWRLVDRVGRNGLFCGAREMQLIQEGERTDDVNWIDAKIPAGQALHFPI
ncbi:putative glycosyltransferase family 69 protein [Phaeoacremonium minimum UCRPA7]|uniref:Putative glycosyltransferase family 69 protein n=1 Tax=Phaeoacremonium minimum (strain UCR-PA7) TaxID=1286976 RepID=R8BD63_PHAM7|nr:putative glycosyltransferase family 69 protein [Phaeoacremonium minimum UCRPA7]EON97227.1 putative glycosyltransferase family 69 protein [Phaeoacremonium minimum UCRPA7]